jgi:acyl-coenzyme A thioesterase PaaI-like protein
VCRPAGVEPREQPLATFVIEVFDDDEQLIASGRLTCMVRHRRD